MEDNLEKNDIGGENDSKDSKRQKTTPLNENLKDEKVSFDDFTPVKLVC
jgi:hypothetical protein